MMRSQSANGIGCSPSSPAAYARIACDDVADERAVLRPRRREARRLVAAPDDDVGRGLDLGDLVAVDHLLVAGEVEHLRAGAAERLPDREQHRVAEAAAGEHDGLAAARSRSACRSAPSARPARRAAAARRDPTSRPSRARSSRRGPRSRSTQAPVSARPSIASRVPSTRRRQRLEVLQPIELARAGSARAAAGARTTTSTIVGVSRSTRTTVARSSPSSAREERRVARADAGATLRQHARHDRIALLRARHRLHDVAGERRMQVAEEAGRAAVGADVGEHRGLLGLGEALDRLDRLARPRRAARKYLPSRWKCAASSRASTVLGCVPAAIRIVRAGSVACAYSCHTPSPSLCCCDTRERAGARRRASTSTASGVRPSAKRMPSSSAFSTSSWLSVYDGLSISRRR